MNEQEQGAEWQPLAEYIVEAIGADEAACLPSHLVRLPGGRWTLWRWVGLRGAGFPAAQMRALAASECGAAADQVIEAEEAAQQARDELMGALGTALEARQRELDQAGEERRERLLGEIRALKQWAMRNLKQGRLPERLDATVAEAALVEGFRAAVARAEQARGDLRVALEAAAAQTTHVLRELVGEARFREAVLWQNRHGFHNSVEALRRTPPGSSARASKQRQREELVATYVQRYCAKNDTIGFFGPVGWARIVPQAEAISARPGPDFLATRSVYFESWCIDTLARELARNKALLPWIAPRRLPFIHLDGTTLYVPQESPARLPAGLAAVLQACDGTRIARDLAAELARNPANGFKSSDQVYSLLASLSARGLISWTLEVSLETYPEKTLRRLLDRIGEESLRRAALGALVELEAARDAVARAAGDGAQLDHALKELETTFTRLTGAASTRSAGKTYAGRTLVYEDCRRDLEVEIGPQLLEALGPPLSLLLTSARWFTFQAAASYRKLFKKLYDELVREAGAPTVDLVNFWLRVQPLLFGENARPTDTLAPLLRERWSALLAIPAGQRHVEYTSEALRPRVLATFDAPGPGWRSVRYHSPDIMIAASSLEAIPRGDYQFVMGELHLGMNTLGAACFLAQHPSREELFQSLLYDLPEPRLMPMISRNWFNLTGRTRPALVSPGDFHLVVAQDTLGGPQSHALPVGMFVVEETDAGLVTRTRDGRLCFDLVETFAPLLAMLVANCFQIVAPSGHTPRVTIDRLVVSRETWRFTAAELPFAQEADEAARFVAIRRWAQASGIPRNVFVKVPVEMKPFYVDFDSPIYVTIFAKMIRRTIEHSPPDSSISVTEMLPTLDQTWLPDAEGQRYTSEFRFVAVDQGSG